MGELSAVRDIVLRAGRALDLRRVFLFGSRARGDAREDSDIDLAFDHRSSQATWAEFVNTMREQAPTLLDLDLIDLDQATPELRARILAEGRLIHG
jgi:hypothetical protein